MKTYRYKYKGLVTVHLPEHRITAIGGDTQTIYETEIPINHPDFEELKEDIKERKEK